MKRFVFIIFIILLFNSVSISQIVKAEKDTVVVEQEIAKSEIIQDTTKNVVTDVIYQHDGKKLLVDVKKIYLNDLYYSFSGETKVHKMDQRLVQKIEYKSGKVEVLNETPPKVREVGDYRKVKVTSNPDDVEGLIEVAKLDAPAEGSSRGNTTLKSLERTATIVLRRKAALVNADIILITDKKSNVAFGEVPSLILYATAYSYR
jgi:hypothetical protein